MRKTLKERLTQGQCFARATENTLYCEYLRTKRLKQKTQKIIGSQYPYFFTFTLRQEDLQQSIKNIKRRITISLSSATSWVANFDIGSENERLHLHALASFDTQVDYTTIIKLWQYGAVKIIPITVKNEKALREYIDKQTNHAEKMTAFSVFYSRSKRK